MTDLAAYLRAVEGDMLKLNHLYCDSCKRTVRTLVQLVRELSGAMEGIVCEAENCDHSHESCGCRVAEAALARAEALVKEGRDG